MRMTKKKETKKAEKKPTTMEVKIEKQMGSSNIKKNNFQTLELENYEMAQSDIELILEYQKKLPVLQEGNENWVDCRLLWKQLGVGKDYTNWIKQQISDMDLEEGSDYSPSKASKNSGRGGYNKTDYNIKVSTAKEIAMVAGAKGGRTSKELKENSKLARKYFIAIESAFKNRKEWNYDRADTLVGFKGLQQAFMKYRSQLLEGLPDWAKTRKNIQYVEFWGINDVIIGMTSNEFRNVMGLNKKESIRNAFTEQQLEYVAALEKFDADLIAIHNIFDFEERHNKLYEKYMLLSKGKFA